MLSPNTTPSLVPEFDVAVHIVLDDFGKAGGLAQGLFGLQPKLSSFRHVTRSCSGDALVASS